MDFYDRLKMLCRDRRVSLSALSDILHFSRGSITAWKNGTVPSADTVGRIRDYFGVSTDYLINGTVTPPAAVYTADPDVEIFECIELLKNEYVRQIVMSLRKANDNDLKRVLGMIEFMNIGNAEQ